MRLSIKLINICMFSAISINAYCFGFSLGKSSISYEEQAYLSCDELYWLASSMDRKSNLYESPLLNDKTSTAASVVSTVTEPASYYFAFYLPWQYARENRAHYSRKKLDVLRQIMADKLCFIK